jgi:gluconokinase
VCSSFRSPGIGIASAIIHRRNFSPPPAVGGYGSLTIRVRLPISTLVSFPIRSPRDPVGGIFVFGRILDKIRLHAQGKLPSGYNVGIIAGKRTFDDRVCKLLGVEFDALAARVLRGGTDEEILEWCFENGRKPDAEHIEFFNGFMFKRGWRDAATPGLIQQRADAGLAHREDIVTFFDLMDVEEGRLP